ncbi:hypothetical protein [Phenylobacterium kunshanense]|uniref:Uncharacterized protein n=1 Tax=Phenylobacterium kunshanense TaxID=1445034 RepID=A0A328BBV6_9CAUL|nr:hypothetical protein [Phenylobacterium kunshanense]RAK64990.1 hypothetical protein DJ019_13375 [Phenylobacterium kunshanense]
MTYSSRESERPALNATRARQGRWGRHVFWVLVFGTLLAGLAMFAAWTWRDAAEGPAGPGQERVVPQTADAPMPPTPGETARQ